MTIPIIEQTLAKNGISMLLKLFNYSTIRKALANDNYTITDAFRDNPSIVLETDIIQAAIQAAPKRIYDKFGDLLQQFLRP